MKIIILIPAFNPTTELTKLINDLKKYQIILVNDGSSVQTTKKTLAPLSKYPNISYLEHKENLGKGAALKTGIRHYLKSNKFNDYDAIITVDADGQHLAKDVINLIEKYPQIQNSSELLKKSKQTLLLGSRKETKKMPIRSRFGNILAKCLFNSITGNHIIDTQTGLRVIPRKFAKELLQIEANGYEFEMEMLILSRKHKIQIKEFFIKTVYLDDNKSSHFNPIIDSIKIYYVFFRFIINSSITAIIDYSIFVITHLIFGNILLSFLCARTGACCYNFTINKKLVFKSNNHYFSEAMKYIGLVILLMLTSYFIVNILVKYQINVYLSKILAEGGLFFFSFIVQHFIIFKKGN